MPRKKQIRHNESSVRSSRTRAPWQMLAVVSLILAGLALALLYVRDSQQGYAARLARLKVLERRSANPLLLRIAGAWPWGMSRLEHQGRASGALYATPLWAQPVPGGFVIGMPYGRDADWTR